MIANRGAGLLISAEYKTTVAHVNTPTYSAVSSPTISVYDPSSSVVVSMQQYSGSNAGSSGLYDATIQSSLNWAMGMYTIKSQAYNSGGFLDIHIEDQVFELI